jgi:hypothetical protein
LFAILISTTQTVQADLIDCKYLALSLAAVDTAINNRIADAPPNQQQCAFKTEKGKAAFRNKMTSIGNSQHVNAAWQSFNSKVQKDLRKEGNKCKPMLLFDFTTDTFRAANKDEMIDKKLEKKCSNLNYSPTGSGSGSGSNEKIDCTSIVDKCKAFTRAVNERLNKSQPVGNQCAEPGNAAWVNKINSILNSATVGDAWNSFNSAVQHDLRQAKKTCKLNVHNKVRGVNANIEVAKKLDDICRTNVINKDQICI